MEPELTSAIDDFVATQSDNPSRSEAIRRILRENLIEDEDALINELYKTGEPGIGAAFLRAIINHLRTFARKNPEVTVDECKEFVLDLFNNYDQDLGDYLQSQKHRRP
ncbi:ribbon-helix-helix domain-containing protein [Sinorhizobium meliloti]|uniref:hypothetical protein n=1 Tax=Rhizobium meliloti TaxID=382 RepID=UPI000FDBC60B|nr:hypothetical protein [Sinorhizobium meliloti]RVK37623.1 hypothetical protein CN163_15945 [Sinorhizobium meliloti]